MRRVQGRPRPPRVDNPQRRRPRGVPRLRRPGSPRLPPFRRRGPHAPCAQTRPSLGGRPQVESGTQAIRAPGDTGRGGRPRSGRGSVRGRRRDPRGTTGERRTAPGGAGSGVRRPVRRPRPGALSRAVQKGAKRRSPSTRAANTAVVWAAVAPRRPWTRTLIRLAVVAHIRHRETPYDDLLVGGCERGDARARVSDQVATVLRAWKR